jgi:hypothetical protein
MTAQSQSAARARNAQQAARTARRAGNRVRLIAGSALAVIAVTALVFAYMARADLLVAAVLAVPAGLYWASLRTHPYVTCKGCKGSGKVHHRIFKEAKAFCVPCGGTGLVPRLGTRLLSVGHRPPNRKGTTR